MAPWFWYPVAAAVLYGAHHIFTRLASVQIGDGVGGFVPTSLNRPYFPGHQWFMASLCWAVALFFAHCARVGMRNNDRQDKQ